MLTFIRLSLTAVFLAIGMPVHSASNVSPLSSPCNAGRDGEEFAALRRTVAVIAPKNLTGSGALISPNELLTSAHIIDDVERDVLVVTCDGRDIPGEVVWIDRPLDLALIKIGAVLPEHFLMRSSTSPIQIGEPVLVAGQPHETPWATSGGVVIDPHRRMAQYSLILSSAQTKKGGSGGPLVDARGDLAGIVVRVLDGGRWGAHWKFASAQSIENFCRAYHHPLCR